MKHDVRGMRVNINVELCKRGHIATVLNGSTHDDQFFDSFDKLWLFTDQLRGVAIDIPNNQLKVLEQK